MDCFSPIQTNSTMNQSVSRSGKATVPLKFRGIILRSLYEKHRNKEMQCVRSAFYTWYIQKKENRIVKDVIDKLLIAQCQPKFTLSRFFYRIKFTIRKQQQQKCLLQQRSQFQQKGNIKIQDSLISWQQKGVKKNFTEYFQSLKNIFSMKLIQCQNQLFSNSQIEQKEENSNANLQKGKHPRFKTEGCEIENSRDGTSKDYIFTEHNEQSQTRKQNKNIEKQKKFKQIGSRVALTLLKSFLSNRLTTTLSQAFIRIAKYNQLQKSTQQIQTLRYKTHESFSANLPTQNISMLSQSQPSFLQTQRSFQSTFPPLQHIDQQINQIEYSISLISQTVQKDQQLQQLYKEFHSQLGDYEAVEKDFQRLRVKTRNCIFDKLINAQRKLEAWLLRQAFTQIKTQTKTNYKKSNTLNLSKSRVNLQTLCEIFSKSLIPPSGNSQNQQLCLRSQKQLSLTSIKMICERNNRTDTKFYKPPTRGGINKKTLAADVGSISNQINTQMQSTFGANSFKQRPTNATQNKPTSFNDTVKSHVNFVLPHSSSSGCYQSSNKKSEMSIGSMKQCFRKKQLQMNSTGFYELSIKSIQSKGSSPSSKYHAQLKSQYWQNESEQKQNIMKGWGVENSGESSSSFGNKR